MQEYARRDGAGAVGSESFDKVTQRGKMIKNAYPMSAMPMNEAIQTSFSAFQPRPDKSAAKKKKPNIMDSNLACHYFWTRDVNKIVAADNPWRY